MADLMNAPLMTKRAIRIVAGALILFALALSAVYLKSLSLEREEDLRIELDAMENGKIDDRAYQKNLKNGTAPMGAFKYRSQKEPDGAKRP
ncbi:MAG: hypothetical protein M0D55_16065 [Elusimicrobiota bacterium]|nr:MAG: hypothetical protein M0D55_16065 [Elusimicrobiota bacterium]